MTTLTTEEAIAAGYEDLDDAISKIEKDKAYWLNKVKDRIYEILEYRDDFNANDLQNLEVPEIFTRKGLIGAAVNSVSREGRMKKSGHTLSTSKSRHGAEIKTYVITDYGRSKRTGVGAGEDALVSPGRVASPTKTSPDPGVQAPEHPARGLGGGGVSNQETDSAGDLSPSPVEPEPAMTLIVEDEIPEVDPMKRRSYMDPDQEFDV